MRTIAIIPARGGSKRLPKKNIYPFKGKPLIGYTIDACKQCPFIDDIFVSSDDAEILETAEAFGAKQLLRPANLADDATPKIIAIRQAVNAPEVGMMERNDIVIVAQANSPQITSSQLQDAYDLMIEHNLWEVMSTDSNGVQNAAFRLVRYHALFNEFLSAHCGFIVAPNLDVHTAEDLEKLGS
jgi:CMP-N,N'-diacetyllegionaminic acid synthase